mgnify:CR=1 FL=1
MITTYKRASIITKVSGLLFSADDYRLNSMDKQARMERVQRSGMSFKARLAAMQAVSVSTAVNKVWV